ncbi:MAG: DUF3136 domain-containing protein [Synechococcus sp.]
MTTTKSALSIGELEAGFPRYCLALRTLVIQGNDQRSIEKTRCWDYLQRLHISLPREYRSPADLLTRYQRSLQADQAE